MKDSMPLEYLKFDLSQWCCRQHSRGSSSNSNYSKPLTVSRYQQKMLSWMWQQMRHQAAMAASRRMARLRTYPAVASSPGNPNSVTHQNRSSCQHMLFDNICVRCVCTVAYVCQVPGTGTIKCFRYNLFVLKYVTHKCTAACS